MKEKTFYKVIEVNFFNGETYVTECADIQKQIQQMYQVMCFIPVIVENSKKTK